VEYDKTKKIPQIVPKAIVADEENFDAENLEEIEMDIPVIEVENQAITRVTLPSRKLKINISTVLLQELEKMGLNFKLN
jgi:DNA polymerase-3 subunit alpha